MKGIERDDGPLKGGGAEYVGVAFGKEKGRPRIHERPY